MLVMSLLEEFDYQSCLHHTKFKYLPLFLTLRRTSRAGSLILEFSKSGNSVLASQDARKIAPCGLLALITAVDTLSLLS